MSQPTIDDADIAAAWNRNAERWGYAVRAGYDVYREFYTWPAFLDVLPDIAGQNVIDLGCGEGENTRRLARLGARMTGVDLSERLIEQARAIEAESPLGVSYRVGSFCDLGAFADASFDAAVSTMALMDGADFAPAMRETFRVLKPGGFLCFSISHPCFITSAFIRSPRSWLEDETGACLGIRVASYFDNAPCFDRWRFSKSPAGAKLEPFEVPRSPRTLAHYVNAVCDAGLRIQRIEEPRPSEEMARVHPWLARWRDHVPMILLVVAEK